MGTTPRISQNMTKADLLKAARSMKSRLDGWQNVYTGMGIPGQDNKISMTFGTPTILTEGILEDIYRGDGFARRVVDLPADDMVREWFYIEGDTNGDSLKALRRLRYKKHLLKALKWSRLFGGAGILIMADDGQDLTEELDVEQIKTIESLKVYSRFELTRRSWYEDADSPKYGQTELYTVNPHDQASKTFDVHESRILKLDGAELPNRLRWQSNDGWGDSVIQSSFRELKNVGSMLNSVATILDEFIIGSLTISNLADLISTGKEELIQKRLQQMDMAKHIMNTILLDDDEKYIRESVTTSGIDKLIETQLMALSGVTGIPVTLLMGKAPAGLQATGASDIRFYYDAIASDQEDTVLPPTEQLLALIYSSSDYNGWRPEKGSNTEVTFNPLWQLTDKEVADTRKVQAEIDVAYINSGVLLPEEVTNSRFGGDDYSLDTAIMYERSPKTTNSSVNGNEPDDAGGE